MFSPSGSEENTHSPRKHRPAILVVNFYNYLYYPINVQEGISKFSLLLYLIHLKCSTWNPFQFPASFHFNKICLSVSSRKGCLCFVVFYSNGSSLEIMITSPLFVISVVYFEMEVFFKMKFKRISKILKMFC